MELERADVTEKSEEEEGAYERAKAAASAAGALPDVMNAWVTPLKRERVLKDKVETYRVIATVEEGDVDRERAVDVLSACGPDRAYFEDGRIRAVAWFEV